jgi:hypothetical protein
MTKPEEELKHCLNENCADGFVSMEHYGFGEHYHAQCVCCNMQGPEADTPEEAARLWNALPRPQPDTVSVSREDIKTIIKKMDKASTGRAAIQADLEQLLKEGGED